MIVALRNETDSSLSKYFKHLLKVDLLMLKVYIIIVWRFVIFKSPNIFYRTNISVNFTLFWGTGQSCFDFALIVWGIIRNLSISSVWTLWRYQGHHSFWKSMCVLSLTFNNFQIFLYCIWISHVFSLSFSPSDVCFLELPFS